MGRIIYCVNGRNEQEIEQYVEDNINLPRINFNSYTEEKPCFIQVDDKNGLVINEESEDDEIKSNTIDKAIRDCEELVIPITSASIHEIQELLDEDMSVHLPRVGIKITRHSNVTNEMLDSLTAYTDDDVIRKHTGGRAPAGTRVENGFLVKNNDYEEIRETLTQYRQGDISKQEAADRINTTKRTIERASDRTELYQLQ